MAFTSIDTSTGGDKIKEGFDTVNTNFTDAQTQIDGKSDSAHDHGTGGTIITIETTAANLGTGSTDGEIKYTADEYGNKYSWDDDNSKWRVHDGNSYATTDLPTTSYTIPDKTVVKDVTTSELKEWDGSAWIDLYESAQMIAHLRKFR